VVQEDWLLSDGSWMQWTRETGVSPGVASGWRTSETHRPTGACNTNHSIPSGRRSAGGNCLFVLVLAVLRFFFAWNISIIGCVVFTLVFVLIFALMDRRLAPSTV
jgi:hypothetical protein